jgi:cytochrome c oxidase subunit 2
MKKLFSLIAFLALTVPAAAENIVGPHQWGWFFQEGHNALNDRFVNFHNYVFGIVTVITFFVLGLMAYIAIRFKRSRNPNPSKTTHNVLLEIIWTIIPIIIVIAVMVPSLKLLYHMDRAEKPDVTLKVVGYQWYWGYSYPDLGVQEFESRLIAEKDLKEGQKRLLEVDEPLYVPVGKTVKVLVTADPLGVIHAWGIQSLAFKRDAIPGRVNEGWIKVDKEGTYYGDCYELCGVDHAFMPVKVVAVSEEKFNEWVKSKGGKIPGEEVVPEAPAEKKSKKSKKSEAKGV